MRLLLCLAEHASEIVSIDDLLGQVWSEVTVAPDSVYQAVTSLRRLLGDDPKQPTYIETVPPLGYRMVATVSPWPDRSIAQPGVHMNVHTGAQANAQRSSPRGSDGEHPTSPATNDTSARGLRLRAAFTLAVGAALPHPHPLLLRRHRNPSPSCRFST